MPSDKLPKILDAIVEVKLREKRRRHMGASSIGNKCLRQSWYKFRWANEEQFSGRMLRLFRRGHEEEHRFSRWLRMADVEVQDYAQRLIWDSTRNCYMCLAWDQQLSVDEIDVSSSHHHIALAEVANQGPKQWSFIDHNAHFAGSSDGRVRGGILETELGLTDWGAVEEKTHSDKSYKHVVKYGVEKSKPVHYVQMQVYMHKFELPWCLYFAVNKNDDALYMEIIRADPHFAQRYIDTAGTLINQHHAPPRISNDPSWFECVWCEFREICHYDAAMEKNCRSCIYSVPVADAGWYCNKHSGTIPEDFIPKGCDDWDQIK